MRYNTPIKLYAEETSYISGQGSIKTWNAITVSDNDTFFTEWKEAYGQYKATAMANGIMETAVVKMPYIPDVYKKLKSVKVVVAKNAQDILKENIPDANNTDAYELYSGVENIREENLTMQFILRRYEAK